MMKDYHWIINKICVLIFILFTGGMVFGYDTFNAENASSSAIGGAYTAYENVPEVLLYNPGAYSGVRKNAIDLNYNKYFTGLETESSLDQGDGYYPVDIYSFSLLYIAPVAGEVSAGGYLSLLNFSDLNRFYTLGVSCSIEAGKWIGLKNKLGTGVTLKYLEKHYQSTLYNESYFKEHSPSISGFGFDAGIHYSVTDDIRAGLSIINLFSSDLGTGFEDKGIIHYCFGFMYSGKISLLGATVFNALMDFDYYNEDFNIAAGGELNFLASGLSFRTGVNLYYLSAGLGYMYDQFIGLNYAASYRISGIEGMALDHKINLNINF